MEDIEKVRAMIKSITISLGVLWVITETVGANPSENSIFEQERHKIRYDYAYLASQGSAAAWDFDQQEAPADEMDDGRSYKSPAKAFLLSLAVPGLGQYYYGSRVKPVAFIGIEAAAWFFHSKWHNDGNQLEDEFEAFNRAHWIQDHYEDYLEIVYGYRDDDSISAQEVSHNLPDIRTQQYYEMTGKYDQFAWGWDDAILYDSITYQDWGTSPPPAITGPSFAPASDRRIAYEIMRDNANQKFDDANKMIMVVLANHVVAAVEAFISTKNINKSVKKAGEFSNWKIKPSLKSYNHKRDTPYLKVTYKF